MRLVGEIWRLTPQRCGCFDFLQPEIDDAVREVSRLCPEGYALLREEAIRDMKDNYLDRLRALYEQPLLYCIHEIVKKYDAVEYFSTSGKNIDALDRSGRDVREMVMADQGKALRERFFLAPGYEKVIRKNFISSQVEFLQYLLEKKAQIEERLLEGIRFSCILRISCGGADMHRHGRTVIGITTDAGTFYYKPHDCGLDAFYHELVSQWFSDCTIAPDVVKGPGYAFVTALIPAEAGSMEDVKEYFMNFGKLLALFHALGSTDMHQENIMSCGRFPSCLDIETILSSRQSGGSPEHIPFPPYVDYSQSASLTGVLPGRLHKGGLMSPLYAENEDIPCLPRYQGRPFTIEGYEDVFIEGFREGYTRMLMHREDICTLLLQYQDSTIRLILRNTFYYYLMRSKLFRPDALSDQAQTDTVLRELRIPYEYNGFPVREELVDYEARCIQCGDIPYYCTSLSGHDLCGEDLSQLVQKDYLERSAREFMEERLSRLSEKEERFEEDFIRASLRHAPLDQPETIPDPYALPDQTLTPEEAKEELLQILSCLQKEIIHNTDGSLSFISDIVTTQNLATSGVLTCWADVGAFCSGILLDPSLHALHEDAGRLARICLDGLIRYQSHCHTWNQPAAIGSYGLGTGLGGILLGLDRMKRAGLSEADAAFSFYLDIAAAHADDTLELFDTLKETCSPWNVKEGAAGLLLAFSGLCDPVTSDLIAAYGQRLLEGLPLSRYDGLEGAAGVGAALAYAFQATSDLRFLHGAEKAFEQVLSAYSPHLKDWPKPNAFMPWAAARSDFAAGIGAAASLALHWSDAEPIRKVQELAIDALKQEDSLARLDSLNNGNALHALCYLLSDPDGTDSKRAGRILKAMKHRKEKHDCYTISQPYVRSYFDVSAALGTIGIGDVILLYLARINPQLHM